MHSEQTLARPGTRRMYSNYGFAVLAETVQQASGIEFGRYLTEAVFEPLGMTATRPRRRRAGCRLRGDVDGHGSGGLRRRPAVPDDGVG